MPVSVLPIPPWRALAIVAAVVLLAGCSSKESRIETGLKKGADYLRTSELDKANVEVRNVLQMDPKNAQAYLLAGQIGETQQEVQRAYASYLKAVELKPELVEAQVGLARMYLFAGELDKADVALKAALALDAQHAGARTLAAAALLRRGRADEAMAAAQAVIASRADVPVETAMLLAGLHANRGERAQALAVIERALQSQPKNTSLLQVAAQIAASAPAGDPLAAQVVGYYRRASAEAPKNIEIWRAWAAHLLQRNDADGAEAVLREAIAAAPKDSLRQLDLLAFLATRRGPAVAEKAYRERIAESPRDMSLRFGLAQLYQGANRPADAQRVLAEIADFADDAPSSQSAKTQMAAYRLSVGQLAEARQLVADVLKANPRDNAALVLRGRMAMQEGRARDAVVDLRAVARDQPGSAEVIGLLAQAHRAAGEGVLGREVLAEAARQRPEDLDLRLLLVSDLAEAKEYRPALAELDALARLGPSQPRLYEARARIALAQNDVAGAEKALVEMKTKLPRQTTGYLRLGQFYAQQKRFDAALKEYDAAALVAPNDAMPYIAAVGLLSGTRRFDEANARIDAHQKADPKNVLHFQLRGDVAVARRDLAAAEQAYRGAVTLAPTIPVGYINTARVLGLRKDYNGAIDVLAAGEKAAPDELALPVARAEWLTRAKRHDEAIALYETLLQRAPLDDAIANNLAYLLTEVKGDPASLARAVTLAGRFAESRNAGYLDSLAWAHHKLGQYDKAVPLLERAVALAPASAIVNLHLGQALVKSGQAERGKTYLRKAIDSKADLPHLDEARALLAQG